MEQTQMNEELKSCPFCGGDAIVVLKDAAVKSNNAMDLYVECESCLATTWGDFIDYLEGEIVGKINQAIEAWNKRH